jgi:hypothetical protein
MNVTPEMVTAAMRQCEGAPYAWGNAGKLPSTAAHLADLQGNPGRSKLTAFDCSHFARAVLQGVGTIRHDLPYMRALDMYNACQTSTGLRPGRTLGFYHNSGGTVCHVVACLDSAGTIIGANHGGSSDTVEAWQAGANNPEARVCVSSYTYWKSGFSGWKDIPPDWISAADFAAVWTWRLGGPRPSFFSSLFLT